MSKVSLQLAIRIGLLLTGQNTHSFSDTYFHYFIVVSDDSLQTFFTVNATHLVSKDCVCWTNTLKWNPK